MDPATSSFGIKMEDSVERSYRITPRTLRVFTALQFNLDLGPSESVNLSIQLLGVLVQKISDKEGISKAEAISKIRASMAEESYSEIIKSLFSYDTFNLAPYDEFIGMKD